MPSPLASIIIPFYNVEEYIAECLTSVANQLLTDVEVILVDDGSQDGSRAIAERFVADDARFVLLTQENAGLGPARNAGVDAASGRYLMFVDSDDIVPPRGVWALVHSLERTGSDFAAGNAKRFTRAKGSYQSWTHADAFSRTELATSLERMPILVKDRMAWNKVYRRSFWDAHDLRFPAIKYEDYPLTLRAYLEADQVDVLADHVYYWRDRESGTSITQQTADLRNASDRLTSALMVLDVLDAHRPGAAVRAGVESYFARVDLVSLADTIIRVPREKRNEAERLAVALAERLDPDAAHGQTQMARLVHTALRRNDIALARAAARFRADGDPRRLLSDVAATRRPSGGLAVARAVVMSKAPQNVRGTRRLRSTLLEAEWLGSTMRCRVATKLRSQFASRASVKAWVTDGDGWYPLDVTSSERGQNGLVITLVWSDPGVLAAAAPGTTWRVMIQVRAAAMIWEGPITADPLKLPGVQRTPEGSGITLIASPSLGFMTDSRPVMDFVISDEGTLTVHSHTPADKIGVERPDPTPDVVSDVVDGRAVFCVADIIAGDPCDDPVSGECERRTGAYLEGQVDDAVLGTVTGAPVVVESTEVSVGRDAQGRAVIRRRPAVR